MTDEILEQGGSADHTQAASRPMSLARAFGWGLLIFLYFAVATVWLVSFAIESLFADFGDFESDVLALGLWGGSMAAGIWGLREAQERGYFE